MGWALRQLEFRWTRAFGRVVSARAESCSLVEDPGLAAWCAETAAGMGLPTLAKRVRVSWNPRMRTTAGRAWWPERKIELNPKLKALGSETMWRTLKHELAHLIAYERSGRKRIQVHGVEWEQACTDLGIGGEQCYHNLPFRRRRMRKRYAYICPACWTSIERVKRIRHAVACHDCCRKHCGGKFSQRFRLVEKRIG